MEKALSSFLSNWKINAIFSAFKMSRTIGIVAYNLEQAFWLVRRYPKLNFLIIYPDEVFVHPVQSLIITTGCPNRENLYRFRNLPTLILGTSVALYREVFVQEKIKQVNNYQLYGNYWLIEDEQKAIQGLNLFMTQ